MRTVKTLSLVPKVFGKFCYDPVVVGTLSNLEIAFGPFGEPMKYKLLLKMNRCFDVR